MDFDNKGTSINYILDVPLWAHALVKSGFIIFKIMKNLIFRCAHK